jgi:hypothetical protein
MKAYFQWGPYTTDGNDYVVCSSFWVLGDVTNRHMNEHDPSLHIKRHRYISKCSIDSQSKIFLFILCRNRYIKSVLCEHENRSDKESWIINARVEHKLDITCSKTNRYHIRWYLLCNCSLWYVHIMYV